MAAPVRAHVGKVLESVRDTVIQFGFIGVRFCIRLRDTLCYHFRVTFLMASVLAVRTLHASSILEELAAESAAHNVVELLLHKLVPVLLVHLLFALANGSLAAEPSIEGLLVPGMFH